MYDEKTRERALRLVRDGLSYRKASEAMGGRPGPAIIRRWAEGFVPTGKRRPQVTISCEEKLQAIQRLEDGENYRSIAEDLGCAPSTVITWRRIRDEKGVDALKTKIDRYLER